MRNYYLIVIFGFLLAGCSESEHKKQIVESDSKDRIEITNDMEKAKIVIPSWVGEDRVIEMSEPQAHSGNYASVTNDTIEFSYYYQEIFSNINEILPKRVVLSGWIYTTVINPKVSIICNINENKTQYNWKAFPLEKELVQTGKWIEFTSEFYFDDKPIKPEMEIGLYAWNQSKKPVYFDDLKITFLY